MLRLSRIMTLLLAIALIVPAAASAARRTDRNHDGLPDRWERVHHLSLKVNQGPRDQDTDGLNNRAEYADHTDPRDADTDGDGVTDANEDRDRDGVVNIAETPGTADAPPAGEHHEGTLVPWDHVVSFDPGSHALVIARGDGTTATALVGEHLFLGCGAAAPGPFQVCARANLTPGAKVIVANHGINGNGADIWTVVLLGVTAPVADPLAPPAPPEAPAPPPAPVAAPPVTGSIVSFGGGVLKIHRDANAEEPAAPLSGIVEIRCITVAGGVVTSNEHCSAEHLVPGAKISLAQGGLADGVFKWMKLNLVVAGA